MPNLSFCLLVVVEPFLAGDKLSVFLGCTTATVLSSQNQNGFIICTESNSRTHLGTGMRTTGPCRELRRLLMSRQVLNSGQLRHINNIPIMQFFTGTSRITQSKSYVLSLTECVWEFRNNALWNSR